MAQHDFLQTATPLTPAANYDALSFTTNGVPIWTDSAGNQHSMAGLNNWYDVTNYGVLASNTAAQNNTAMTNLIGLNFPQGSTIYFPAGTFQFSAAWPTINTNYIFQGTRGGTSLAWVGASVGATLITVNSNASPFYSEFRDIQFTSFVTQTAGYVLDFTKTTGAAVRNCLFEAGQATPFFGLIAFSDATNGGNQCVVEGVLASGYQGNGIFVGGTLSSIMIDNCLFNGTFTGGHALSGVATTSAGAIQICNSQFILAMNCLNLAPTTGLTVASVYASNCYFDQGVTSALSMSGAGTVVRSHFTGCWFTLASGSSATSAVVMSTSGSSIHSGTQFTGCHILNTNAATTSNGINMTAVSDVMIEGCDISGWTASGIAVTPVSPAGTTTLNIQGNTIGPTGGFGANTTGVTLNAGAVTYGQITLANNQMVGNTTTWSNAATFAATSPPLLVGNTGLNAVNTVNLTTPANITTTTETVVLTQPIPANSCIVGTTFRVTVYGTATITTTSTLALTLHWGTAGTIADQKITPATNATVTATTANNNWKAAALVTVRATGGAGTASVMTVGEVTADSATGASPLMALMTPTTTTASLATNVASLLSVAIVAGTASTVTVSEILVEVARP